MVGYNVQASVDTKHHLIVTHEVVNEGHDRRRFDPWRGRPKETLGAKDLTVLADRGYFNGEEILKCEQARVESTGAEADDLELDLQRSLRQARLHV